ncbi:MAG: type III pantothenate kinase [Oscillospiraceae bacterium]
MLLAIDIGNSNIVLGYFKGKELVYEARIKTDAYKTEYEYAVLIKELMRLYSFESQHLIGAIVSSVVPPLSEAIEKAIKLINDVPVLHIGPGIKTGLNIKIDNPAQLGADLAATAIGAIEKYPLPALIIDLGTATKFSYVDKNKNFCGGSIMPGVMISLEALISKTAQLPSIGLESEVKLIGTNTVDCMKSGIILGAASMVDGMIDRFSQKIGQPLTIVACGGMVNSVIPHCTHDITIDESLLLEGLCAVFYKNIQPKNL